MSWWRLLGEEWMPESMRGELWRQEHPELAARIATLLRELEDAGIDPRRWPHPRETVHAGPFQMALMVIKATDGYEAVVATLEKRWAHDRRNPGFRKQKAPLTPTRDELEEIRASLIAEGKPYGYTSIANAAGCSRSTVRRHLGAMK